MRRKVTVVGAGNVGATAAQEIARRDYADVVLVDIKEGLPQGKALDIDQAGARHAYFGHDEWERQAPGLKTIEDAVRAFRERYGQYFERCAAAAGSCVTINTVKWYLKSIYLKLDVARRGEAVSFFSLAVFLGIGLGPLLGVQEGRLWCIQESHGYAGTFSPSCSSTSNRTHVPRSTASPRCSPSS